MLLYFHELKNILCTKLYDVCKSYENHIRKLNDKMITLTAHLICNWRFFVSFNRCTFVIDTETKYKLIQMVAFMYMYIYTSICNKNKNQKVSK